MLVAVAREGEREKEEGGGRSEKERDARDAREAERKRENHTRGDEKIYLSLSHILGSFCGTFPRSFATAFQDRNSL